MVMGDATEACSADSEELAKIEQITKSSSRGGRRELNLRLRSQMYMHFEARLIRDLTLGLSDDGVVSVERPQRAPRVVLTSNCRIL